MFIVEIVIQIKKNKGFEFTEALLTGPLAYHIIRVDIIKLMATPIITEEWLTILEVGRLFEVSEKQVRRIIKKLLKVGSHFAKQEITEGKIQLPEGKIIDAYVFFIATKKVYELWQPRLNQKEILQEMGRHIETMPTHI